MPIINLGGLLGPNTEPQKMKGTTPADTGVDIYDKNGNKVGNVPFGTNGIRGAGETVYRGKDKEGNDIFSTDAYDIPPTITLNDATGQITIRAPKDFLNSEIYSQYFDDDVLRGLGNLYAQNKDAKVEMADGTEKTVKELIESWNEDLPNLVAGQRDFSSMKEKFRERLGDEGANNYNLKTYQIMGMSAYSGRDDDLITIPKTILNSPRWSFLKDLKGFDANELAISKKDFTDGYYHLDAIRDAFGSENTSIAQLKKDASEAMANYQGDDADEFARMIAFNNYLNDQTAEGASNAPDGAFVDKIFIGGTAVAEGAIRATAQTGTTFVNNIGNLALAPFSAVDWAASGFQTWEWKNPVDGMASFVDKLTGGDGTLQGYKTATGFLEAEYAKRGQFYELTNGSAYLAYTLSYLTTSIVETYLQAKLINRLVLNTVALGISGAKISSIAKPMGEAWYGGVKKYYDAASGSWMNSTQLALRQKIYPQMVNQGTAPAIAAMLTKQSNLSFFDTLKLLSSIDPSVIVSGAYAYSAMVNQAADALSAGAFDNLENFKEWYQAIVGKTTEWKTIAQLTADYNRYKASYEALWSIGTSIYVASAKALKTLNVFAKYVPTVWYTSQVVLSTAFSEAGNIRRLLDGVDSDEERDYIWQMIARTLLGWTIGIAISKAVNAVANGWDAEWMERANAKTTEKIAQAVNWYEQRVDQVHEIVGGPDYVDNLKNPQRKAAVKFNQSLAKSQEYMAKAGDAVRMAGGSEAEAISAVMTAKAQKNDNDNAIDLKQNPELLVAAWHSPAYPAYANASETFDGVHNEVAKQLKALGLDRNIKTTALVAGIASNGDLPQDIVNYQVRALQRASYLRDDYDYSSALTLFEQNLDFMDVSSVYVLQSPSYIRERETAIKYMKEVEAKYPASLTNYIKDTWVPAAQQAAFQLNQILYNSGYYLKFREEGWKQSGMFGLNNQLWFPVQRITDAQKDFEEATRNPMSITRSGVLKRRFYEPEHYSPGSEEMTDFVNPMITFRGYEFQQAVEYANRNFVDINLQNPYVKHIVRLDGKEVGAVKIYKELAPSYAKGVKIALGSVKKDLDVSGLVSDMLDKQKMETKIRNAQKAVDAAKETWDNIPKIDVKVTQADRLRTIEGLSEDAVDNYLNRLRDQKIKDLTKQISDIKAKLATPKDAQRPESAKEQSKGDLEKQLKAAERKLASISGDQNEWLEGEKVDVYKWLNNKTKGFDVLDWSLLGRKAVNGLIGGYGDKYSGYSTRVYLMDTDSLRKLMKLPKTDVTYGKAEVVSSNINTEGAGALIPLSYEKGEIYPEFRWYRANPIKFDDWNAFLSQLEEKGQTIVPVAMTVKNQPSDKIGLMIRRRLGDDEAAQDVTEEVLEAYEEYGGERWLYHTQQKALGKLEYNTSPRAPYQGVGDAYWISPNRSYVDKERSPLAGDYGKNVTEAKMPIKDTLVTDDELRTEFNKLAQRYDKLLKKADSKKEENEKQVLAAFEDFIRGLDDWEYYLDMLDDSSVTDGLLEGNIIEIQGKEFNPNKIKLAGLTKKEDEERRELAQIIASESSYDAVGRPREFTNLRTKDYGYVLRSYRKIAERLGKPLVEISETEEPEGTAYLYYKGIDEKFDKEYADKLSSQAVFQKKASGWLEDEIANAMEKYDSMSLDEMIDSITNGEGWGEDWDMALEDFGNGEISSSELTEDFQERVSRVAKKYPGIAQVMRETWDNNAIQDLRDMKFKYWHPSTGYPTIDDRVAVAFLEEMGEKAPNASEELVSPDQRSFYDMLTPTAENIPAYTEQDITDIRLRNLARKRKILKRELKELCY